MKLRAWVRSDAGYRQALWELSMGGVSAASTDPAVRRPHAHALALSALALAALLLATPRSASASLSFCNKTNRAIKVAFAYAVMDAPGTSTGGHGGATVEGWYDFVPGECGKVSEVSAREAAIFYHAVGRGKSWTGTSRLCVRNANFSDRQLFLRRGDSCPRGSREAGFRGAQTNGVNHTVNLE